MVPSTCSLGPANTANSSAPGRKASDSEKRTLSPFCVRSSLLASGRETPDGRVLAHQEPFSILFAKVDAHRWPQHWQPGRAYGLKFLRKNIPRLRNDSSRRRRREVALQTLAAPNCGASGAPLWDWSIRSVAIA